MQFYRIKEFKFFHEILEYTEYQTYEDFRINDECFKE